MSSRNRHPKKEIEDALQYAESKGWRVEKAGKSSHAWGKIYSPDGSKRESIYSTPRSPGNHARHIEKAVNRDSSDNE